jgi:hypothetical protein
MHAPSRPKCKGTKEIQHVIDELVEEGYRIEFKLLQNVPNSEVRQIIQQVDLVIDELYSDTFMGGLGSEAAATGVPFLTFGFAKQELMTWFKTSQEFMDGYSDPTALKNRIVWAMTDVKGRNNLAQAQYAFQNNYWNNERVANRFTSLASGEFPINWIFHCDEVDYIWGAGMPQDILLSGLESYTATYGKDRLFLNQESKLFSEIVSKIQ